MAITKKNDPKNNTFWQSAENARGKVESWPSWKRNLKVTQYSVGFDAQSSEPQNSGQETSCKRKS